MRFPHPRLVFVFCCLFAFLPVIQAQIPGIPNPLNPAAASSPTVETPEATDARLQLWLKEARGAFARVNDADAVEKLPEGLETEELLDYRRDLEQIILAITRYQKMVATLPDVRKGLEAARAADLAWKGFSETPPYSILMIDELMNQRDAIKEKTASYSSSIELFTRALSSIQEEARAAEETSRRILSDAAQSSSDDNSAKWRLKADQAKSRLLVMRANYLQANVSLLRDQLDTAQIQLGLLDRQISTAKKNSALTDEDIAKVKKAAEDRQAAIRTEVAAVRKRQQNATTARVRLQAAVDQILKSLPEGAEAEPTPELSLARVKVEAAETRGNVLQFVEETLESLEQAESYIPEAYQIRKNLMDASTTAKREAALQVLRSNHDRLKAWEVVNSNGLAGVNADIGAQETRASVISADDPRLAPINDIRAALWEKQAVVQRLVHSVAAQRKILKRWLAEFDNVVVKKSFTERIADAKTSSWAFVAKIWTFEVFKYKDTVMVSGVPITEEKGVALGKFIIAISFFLITYLFARRINNHLRNVVVRRGHIADAQAKTLGNWLMIVVSFILVVSTLHFLKIPLTVFAFFGGALAIGLGFGTQTLIKNFISGIIVLFERKIRVGDIVDIGGISGTVTEINTRSSILRGGDGKETLVPNSVFLENRITNLTLSNRRVRRTLSIRVALGTSPAAVVSILKECVERHGLILTDPAPVIAFDDMADNAYAFMIYYWVEFNDKTNGDVVASDIRFMVEKRFKEAEIDAPGAKPDLALTSNEPLQLELLRRPKDSDSK